jgi:hypothetical protein
VFRLLARFLPYHAEGSQLSGFGVGFPTAKETAVLVLPHGAVAFRAGVTGKGAKLFFDCHVRQMLRNDRDFRGSGWLRSICCAAPS